MQLECRLVGVTILAHILKETKPGLCIFNFNKSTKTAYQMNQHKTYFYCKTLGIWGLSPSKGKWNIEIINTKMEHWWCRQQSIKLIEWDTKYDKMAKKMWKLRETCEYKSIYELRYFVRCGIIARFYSLVNCEVFSLVLRISVYRTIFFV
jgi:hypothetical protein